MKELIVVYKRNNKIGVHIKNKNLNKINTIECIVISKLLNDVSSQLLNLYFRK